MLSEGALRAEAGAAPASATGARRLAGAGSLALLDQAVVSGTSFATGVVVGRVCAPEQFGLYMLGLTVVLFLTEVQSGLVSTPFTIRHPRLPAGERPEHAGSALLQQLGFGALAVAILAVAAAGSAMGAGPEGLAPVLGALAAVVAFVLLREHLRRVSLAALELRTLLAVDACVAVAQLAGLGLAASWLGLSAASALLLLGVGAAAGVGAWALGSGVRHRLSPRRALAQVPRSWELGRWVVASGALWAVNLYLYPWFLAVLDGPEAAGLWAAGFGIAALANPVLLGIGNLAGPEAAHALAAGGPERLRRATLRLTATAGLLLLPVSALCVAYGGALAEMVYGPAYAGLRPVVAFLALHVLFTALALPSSRALFALEGARLDFAANLLALLVLLTAGLWLTARSGPAGAAAGLALASGVATLLRMAAARRLMGAS